MATEQGRQRLADRVRRERLSTGKTQQQLATTGGVSLQTWRNVEAALPAKDRTYGGVDRAFGWAPGTAEGIATEAQLAAVADRASVEDAIRGDERLLPEARAHLLAQYQLLLRVAPAGKDTAHGAELAAEGREVVADMRATDDQRGPSRRRTPRLR